MKITTHLFFVLCYLRIISFVNSEDSQAASEEGAPDKVDSEAEDEAKDPANEEAADSANEEAAEPANEEAAEEKESEDGVDGETTTQATLTTSSTTTSTAKSTTTSPNSTTTLPTTQKVANLFPDLAAYPQPLPTAPPKPMEPAPYKTLYQGLRYKDDQRVFRKRFEHEAEVIGQQIVCQGLFDCIISHIAIESTEAIPVLLRGGAGYRHFTAVVKSRPYRELKGQIRVYCRNKYVPEDKPDSIRKFGRDAIPPKTRRFDFGINHLDESNELVKGARYKSSANQLP